MMRGIGRGILFGANIQPRDEGLHRQSLNDQRKTDDAESNDEQRLAVFVDQRIRRQSEQQRDWDRAAEAAPIEHVRPVGGEFVAQPAGDEKQRLPLLTKPFTRIVVARKIRAVLTGTDAND